MFGPKMQAMAEDAATAGAGAPAPAAEKPKKEKKPKAEPKPKVERLKQNGETRPAPGGKTAVPWDIADQLSRDTGKPAVRKDVIEKCVALGHSAAMSASQYGRWRRFNGLGREKKVETAPAAGETAPATTTTTPASDVSVEPPKAS